MNLASILGAFGVGIGLIRAVPQLARLRRTVSARGVSLDTAATSCIVSFGWAIYGVLMEQRAVTMATGSSGAIFGMVALAAISRGRRLHELRAAPMWLAALAAGGGTFGAQGLGVLLPLSVVVANVPQLLIVCRERELTELSAGTWLLSLADGVVWGLYALVASVPVILAYGLLQFGTSALILLRLWTWRRARYWRAEIRA